MNASKAAAREFFALLNQPGKWGMDGRITGDFRGTISGVAAFRPAGRNGQTVICEEDRIILLADNLEPIARGAKTAYQLNDDMIVVAEATSPVLRLVFGTSGRAIGAQAAGKTQHELALKWQLSNPDLFSFQHRVTAPSHSFIATTNFRRLTPGDE